MKFDIDVKTGMIIKTNYDIDPDHNRPVRVKEVNAHSFDLEQILQAVKKTQEKLVNKQIQEIQDSKNYISLEPNEALEFVEVDPKIIKAVGHENDVEISKGNFVTIKSIEQNQKIVDEIIQSYRSLVKDGALKDVHEVEFSIVQELESIIEKSTGKDIKEL